MGETVEAQWAAFFREVYVRLYGPFLAPLTEQEVEGICSLLPLSRDEAILDLGCGTGRHAIALAKKKYTVVGLDLDKQMLEIARSEAQQQKVGVEWVCSDMRSIPFEGIFGTVLSLFSSFGFFEEEDGNLLVLEQTYRVLKPGGFLLLDILPLSRALYTIFTSPEGITKYGDGLIVVEARQLDLLKSRYTIEATMVYPEGGRKNYASSLRVYTPTELHRMLLACGFKLLGCYGSVRGEALTCQSRLVMVCQKPGLPPKASLLNAQSQHKEGGE